MDGSLDPVVEAPSEEANEKQVAKGQQEIGRFFSKLSNVKVADKLKERKVNEVEGEGDFP